MNSVIIKLMEEEISQLKKKLRRCDENIVVIVTNNLENFGNVRAQGTN